MLGIGRLKALLAARKAYRRGQKEGQRMTDKPLPQSMTIWGAIIAAFGALVNTVGNEMSNGSVDWGAVLPEAIKWVGMVVTVIGARRKLGQAATGN